MGEGGKEILMEYIIIIWLSPCGLQRAVFEMPCGDIAEAGRIFEKINQTMLAEGKTKNAPMLDPQPGRDR